MRKIVQLITKTIPKLPAILEIELQHVQGKGSGSGSGTTEVEATTALNFTPWSNANKLFVLVIGANIGSYSEAIRKFAPQATVFAFEPSSVAHKILEEPR